MNSVQQILIVDDRLANLVALEQTLEGVNAQVVRANGGDEALRATLDHDFALAILDVNMPGMDGYELADLLHGDERTHYLPIIFLTAVRMEDQDVFKGYESGAVDYIVKPYSPAIMISKVEVFLLLDQQRRQLRLQQKQLEAANRELETFTYSVSHDLRAPLRALDGFSQALVEEYADQIQGDGQTYLRYLQESSREMTALIEDMLRLSRATRGKMKIQAINLSTMAEKITEGYRRSQPDRTVTMVVPPNIITNADYGLMLSTLDNLLSNAWKFTANRNQAVIEFGKINELGQWAYYVRDNGVGFDMHYADKLFTPFERLHRQDEFSGTGIGLATVQRIIHRHGGEVWGKSEPDKGATFFFTLNAVADPPELTEPTPLDKPETSP
ncbi:MAG: response regulator [Sedimenticola sp.]